MNDAIVKFFLYFSVLELIGSGEISFECHVVIVNQLDLSNPNDSSIRHTDIADPFANHIHVRRSLLLQHIQQTANIYMETTFVLR